MRIAYLSAYEARDRRDRSGTPHAMARALGRRVQELDLVGPAPLPLSTRLLLHLEGAWRRAGAGGRHPIDRSPRLLRSQGEQARRLLAARSADLLFAAGSTPLAHVGGREPAVFWGDATFAALLGYYPEFGGLCAQAIREGHAAERAALARCDLAFYASDWAARSAVEDYGLPPEKALVVPYGANLEREPTRAEAEEAIAARAGRACTLLFVGRDWRRQGGDLALALAAALNAAGLPTELAVAGCRPELEGPPPPWLRVLGFLDKGRPEDRDRLGRLLATSHFLVLPSRAERFGVVVAEAAAHGLPALTTDVGGLPSAVRDNGHLFPVAGFVEGAAARVLALFADPGAYLALARAARAEFERRLSWDAATRTVLAALESRRAPGGA